MPLESLNSAPTNKDNDTPRTRIGRKYKMSSAHGKGSLTEGSENYGQTKTTTISFSGLSSLNPGSKVKEVEFHDNKTETRKRETTYEGSGRKVTRYNDRVEVTYKESNNPEDIVKEIYFSGENPRKEVTYGDGVVKTIFKESKNTEIPKSAIADTAPSIEIPETSENHALDELRSILTEINEKIKLIKLKKSDLALIEQKIKNLETLIKEKSEKEAAEKARNKKPFLDIFKRNTESTVTSPSEEEVELSNLRNSYLKLKNEIATIEESESLEALEAQKSKVTSEYIQSRIDREINSPENQILINAYQQHLLRTSTQYNNNSVSNELSFLREIISNNVRSQAITELEDLDIEISEPEIIIDSKYMESFARIASSESLANTSLVINHRNFVKNKLLVQMRNDLSTGNYYDNPDYKLFSNYFKQELIKLSPDILKEIPLNPILQQAIFDSLNTLSLNSGDSLEAIDEINSKIKLFFNASVEAPDGRSEEVSKKILGNLRRQSFANFPSNLSYEMLLNLAKHTNYDLSEFEPLDTFFGNKDKFSYQSLTKRPIDNYKLRFLTDPRFLKIVSAQSKKRDEVLGPFYNWGSVDIFNTLNKLMDSSKDKNSQSNFRTIIDLLPDDLNFNFNSNFDIDKFYKQIGTLTNELTIKHLYIFKDPEAARTLLKEYLSQIKDFNNNSIAEAFEYVEKKLASTSPLNYGLIVQDIIKQRQELNSDENLNSISQRIYNFFTNKDSTPETKQRFYLSIRNDQLSANKNRSFLLVNSFVDTLQICPDELINSYFLESDLNSISERVTFELNNELEFNVFSNPGLISMLTKKFNFRDATRNKQLEGYKYTFFNSCFMRDQSLANAKLKEFYATSLNLYQNLQEFEKDQRNKNCDLLNSIFPYGLTFKNFRADCGQLTELYKNVHELFPNLFNSDSERIRNLLQTSLGQNKNITVQEYISILSQLNSSLAK